jgi:hypothetical protein
MTTSNNIYNILNKLASLEPQPPKQESLLKQLNEGAVASNPLSLKDRLAKKLAEAKEVDEDMLTPKQKEMDKNDNGKIDASDLAALRAGKGKKEEGAGVMHFKAQQAKADGKDSFKLGDKEYPVKEAKEKTMSRAAKGYEKYGKEGMQALAKAGREGKDLDKVRDKYNKYDDKEDVKEGEYQDAPNKSAIPAFQRKAKAAPGDDSWKTSQQDLDDEASKSPTGSAGLAKAKARLGMNEELQADDGEHYDNEADFFGKFDSDHFDKEEESNDGMEVRGYIDGVNVMAFRYDDESKTSGYGVYNDDALSMNEEEQYDENNANSSLPGTRRVTDEEHSEYDAAAHTVRKWMRKRGWDPKSEFKPAMKYIMDNLDSKHDDTLTDEVKNACKKCAKHHETIEEAGLDMNLLKGAQGGMRGVNTDPESERNSGKKYGYRNDRDDTGNDDDYDEHGNEKKGVKKSAPGDAPKTKGRPKKNFGPERTTAKAYKHKGSRVAESINLETYVEDTMAELEAIFVMEKAKSKSQQKFFGMVHAAQKGEKPASKEVAKVAKDIGKKDAEDFASTKHKGLPDKVKKKKVDESILTENTLQAIVRRFGKEVREFAQGGDFDQDLFEALYDYYFDDMPYGVKKARDGDPYEWVSERFHDAIEGGDVEISETRIHDSLNELAKLAGLPSAMDEQATDEGNEFSGARANAIRAGKDSFEVGGKAFSVTGAEDEQMNEGGCNMTAEGQYCEMHGMNECGMMESEEKPDYADIDGDNDEKESMKDAAKDKEELEECGDMSMGGMSQEDGVSINTSMDTKTGRKTVTVTADGEAAEELASMLKMAGMIGKKPEPQVVRVGDLDEYANEPDERIAPVSAVTASGNDMHKSKAMYKHSYKQSDNPMAIPEGNNYLEARLARMLDKIRNAE